MFSTCCESNLTIEKYDIATDTWTNYGTMNSAHYQGSVTLDDAGKIVVTGGFNGGTATDVTESCDLGTKTWTTLAPQAVADRWLAASTKVSTSRLYVLFGLVAGANATSGARLS